MKQEVTKRLPDLKTSADIVRQRCSVIATLKLFATKWKPCIICYLGEKHMRYNELFRAIPNISRKVLSEHLAELRRDALIIRIQYDAKLQQVEYRLSETGKSLLPLLSHIEHWGLKNIQDTRSIKEMIEQDH